MKSWNTKRVLITGGTSGLGKALAEVLVEKGAAVAIVARGQERLKSLMAANSQIHTVQGDVSKKEEIYSILGEAHQKLGGIDMLINNASTLGTKGLKLLSDTECEEFENAIQTNLLGPFRLTRAVLAPMLVNGGGWIINISSDAAVNPYSSWGVYGSSKAALDHMTRIWQAEYKDSGIHFLSIDPGDMNTPLHFEAVPNADPLTLREPKDSATQIIKFIECKFMLAATPNTVFLNSGGESSTFEEIRWRVL